MRHARRDLVSLRSYSAKRALLRYTAAMSLPVSHWLEKAAEAKTIAAGLHDPAARRTMLEIALRYEKLARHTALAAGQKEHSESDGPPGG